MKILHVINHLNIGGAERLVTQLLPEFKKINVEDVFLCLSLGEINAANRDELLLSKIIPIVLGERIYSFRAFFFLLISIFKIKPDLIHVHLFPSQFYVALICKFLKIPYIITEHNTDNGRRNKSYLKMEENFVYRNATGIASISNATYEGLNNFLKLPLNNSLIIENGIPVERIRSSRKYSKDQFDFPLHSKLLISVGRLTYQKGFFEFLDVIPLLGSNIHWCIVGEGEQRKKIEAKIKLLNIGGSVTLMGERNDVWSLLKIADMYIQPSLFEGFGLAALEAMAQGVPIIHSGCPGLADVIGDAGVDINIKSPVDCARVILSILNNDKKVSELVSIGFLRVEEFSINETVKKYLDLYSKCIIRK